MTKKTGKVKTITVLNESIRIIQDDYISLTDMLKSKDGDFFISDWLRNRNTVEYLGIWERIHNPDFNYGEFATIRNQTGLEQPERLTRLNHIAIAQMKILVDGDVVKDCVMSELRRCRPCACPMNGNNQGNHKGLPVQGGVCDV